MGKLLLTSSQVSIVLSSGIIILFTTLLFLAGYIVQQQSLERLNEALRPQQPSPRHGEAVPTVVRQDPRSRLSRPLGRLREQLHWTEPSKFNWSKFAHAQIAREAEELCHALIVLHDLHRLQSPAPRLLMFPRRWLDDHDDMIVRPNKETEKLMQLLKKASRRYRAVLVPIDPLKEDANVTDAESYSLASAFSLTNYERVIMLPTPSLILDTKKLDSMLAFFEPTELASYPLLQSSSTAIQSSIILIKPSKEAFLQLSQTHSTESSDSAVLRAAFKMQDPLLSDDDPDFQRSLYTTLKDMRMPLIDGARFNLTTFSENTALVSVQDDGMPGPQYEVPYQMIVSHRPKDEDQGFVWEKLHSTYKDRRYKVCGMDLMDWKGSDDVRVEL